MRNIIIAGAGHGGLVAAIHLAKNGDKVTVYEKRSRENLGHDWHDWLSYDAFDGADIPRPPEKDCIPTHAQCFWNPKGNVGLDMPDNRDAIIMDRKVLINYLVTLAEEAGAELVFGVDIVAPITEKTAVKGMIIRRDGALEEVFADLVIDSCGMYSPLRSKLPASFNIDSDINKRSIFHVYRAYYENTTGEVDFPPYGINLFHMYRPGLDWTVTKEDYVDILVGKFSQSGELTQAEIDDAVADFKKKYPYIGEKIVRGGSIEDIPISRMLPLIVADGYAAVGDAAGMTVPLNGSGIILSMNGGKILAETVRGISGELTKKELWKYEYEYFTKHAKELVIIDIIKTVFTYVDGGFVDYLVEKGILTREMLKIADGGPVDITAQYILHVLSVSLPILKKIPAIAKCLKTVPLIPVVCSKIPEKYDETKVNRWIKAYKAL